MKKNVFQKSMLCLFTALLCIPMTMQAKVEHLLPKVHSLTETKGTPFALKRTVTITDANNTVALEKVFTDYGCAIEDEAAATVTVEMVQSIEGAYDYTLEGYDNEGYQLIVETNAITIKAVKPIGVIRAAQTLAQLAEGYDEGQAAIETVEITDWAAFKLRGYMHDVGRSFISVEELKKHIDLLSRFKVNTYHWHFTENQAWRFEVKGYPQLTSTESMTRFAGKYYTQDECREVAQYAHERGVTIIPEIDMPGHSEAFHRAMGFDMQTDEGVDVLKKVLTQVAAVFPNAPYIHIGADEKGITYPNFLGIMADHIHGLGRKMIVWNPISGVSINSNMCDMTQMWSSRGTDIKGVPDIDCRYNYTNHFDVFADVVGIYKSNIYYADKGSEEIAGTISAYWNDRKTPTEEDIVKQNNMYANVLASAERAWIGSKVNGNEGYIEKLGTTLPNSGEVYEEFKSWEERFLFHKAHSLKGQPIPYVKQTNVRWRITDPFPNGGNSGATFAPDQYATSTNDEGLIPETFTHEGKTYYTGMATGAGIYLRHTWGNNIIPTYYGTTNHSNMTAYAWTYVYSPKTQTVGAQIEFQNYGRSEQDSAPDAGKWDRKGSDIWLNGSRINPPTWDNTGKGINNEVDLGNENFTARNPIEVTLNAGWNKVFIKLPYVGAGGVRLNKWMFTCVFTTLDGVNAVDGLIYSPNQCMDEATELVAAKVSEIKRDRSNYIGTAVGLWPETAAEELDAEVEAIEATYAEEKSAEERAAQVAALEEAWAAFIASLTGAKINLPVSGNYYRMYTPGRENRYPTGKGAGNAIIGEQNPTTKASIWQFVSRGDNSYDIVNFADGTYISPASNNNTALNAVAEKPTAGWVVKAAGSGKVIITSGNSVQLHQTNNGNGYKLFNWGANSNEGTFNTTDGGCVYQLIDVTSIAPATPIKLLTSYEEFENGGVYSFVTERGWMGATANSNNVISTARTTVSPAASADNPYFQWTVYQSKNGNYYLYNIGKKKFMGVQSSNNASVPLVDNPAGKLLTFKNSSSTTYPIMFSTDNAGVVNHTPHHGEGLVTWTDGWEILTDEGSNHQVALICTLDDEALAKIADLVEAYDVYDENASAAPQPFVKLECLEKKSYPYAIDDVLADKVFAETNITIALDVTMPASLASNTRYALVCAADPTQAATGATQTNSPYVAYGLNGSNPAYLPSSASGDKFTYRESAFTGNTNYKVVYVIDRTNKKFYIYVDGALKSSADYPVSGYELQSFSNFATNANAKLYIGGGIVSNTTSYDVFGGQVSSVQFFDEALTAEKIALIEYPLTQDQQNELRVVEKLYRPTKRVTVLESGKKYMIYDTAEGRTGFIKNAGTSLGHSGTNAQSKPATFSGDESYLWAVETVDAADSKYYLKASNGKYVNATGSTDNAAGQDLYIQSWKTSKASKSNINSESEEGTITPNAEIGEGVWTISGSKEGHNGQNCWNGNSGSWAKWSDCHPYAFYDYELQASIEIPQNALTYYIAADALQSDGSYAKHYLYNNNGTLATSATYVRDDAKYMWTATVDAEGNYTFANGAGQYLGYGASGSGLCMADAPVSLNISKANAVHVGSLGMLRIGTDNAGKWMVTKVDGTEFNRNSDKVNNGSWTSDYTFAYVNGTERMLTIVNNTPNSVARYSWNGKEFDATLLFEGNEEVTDATLQCVSHNAAYTFVGFYSDENFTKQVTSIAELTEDMTLYAKFELAIFSASYGSKWINIARSADANHLAILNSSDANAAPIFNIADYANEGILWCFVGNSESFKIYNKVSGETLALTPSATPAREVTVKMVAAADAQSWHLIKYDNGYVITPVGNTSHGINSYGGNDKLGGELKFWEASDGGTHWNFNLLELLAIKAEADDWNESNPNTHFGSVRITNNGGSALAKLTLSNRVASNIIYTAAKDDAEVDFTRAYRGFEFQGYWLGDEKLGSNFTLTEELKAAITEQNPLVAKFTTTDDVTLFYDDDEFSYRIPAIATTSTGRLIAVSDYRHNLDDIGRDVHGTGKLRLDLVMRYSDDNGKTWSAKQTIAEGTGNKNADGYDCAYGDAAIATVGQNVLVMAAAGNVCYPYASADKHNRTVRVFSADNGATWVKEDITDKMFIGEDALIPNGHAAFFGSGKLAVDTNFNGTGKARIYGAMLVKNASTTTNIFPIYTDDLGQNWKILGGSTTPVANADEPKIEILPNGQILLSARRNGGRKFNVFTYGTGADDKANGSGTWDEAQDGCGNTGSNGTNGEVFCVDAEKADGTAVKLLMQSQPKGGSGQYDRKDVSIWYKEVSAGVTYKTTDIKDGWTLGMQVSTQQSSYSTMALQQDGKIAFFFEEAPCYGDDYTKGYCMVYVPLTIEEITKNAYKTTDDVVVSKIGTDGIGTFYANEPMTIPAGVKAYVATTAPVMNGTDDEDNDVGTITMTAINDGIIPAQTGAVIRGAEGSYTFTKASAAGTAVTDNMLYGYAGTEEYSVVELPTDGSKIYVLAVEEDGVGFYWKDKNFKVYKNKAYLKVPAAVEGVRSLAIRFEGSTEIETSTLNPQPSTEVYDLMGRRVLNPTKGMYIVNGRKAVIK